VAFYKEEKRNDNTMKDPVCGMEVDEKHDSASFEGRKYYFCCASCRWAFENDPKKFADETQ
jgi:YHS domain-containing protein